MKKLKLIFGMLLISSLLNAQNDWNESGNTGTSSTTDFIGTTDPEDLSFRTNNTIKMQLESTGELGLGTTSPAAWFHILTNGSGTVASSEVFRTVVPGSTASYWRMYRGSDKMADLFFGSTANAFNIHATRGPLHLHSGSTGGADIEAFEIVGGTGSDAGFVG